MALAVADAIFATRTAKLGGGLVSEYSDDDAWAGGCSSRWRSLAHSWIRGRNQGILFGVCEPGVRSYFGSNRNILNDYQ